MKEKSNGRRRGKINEGGGKSSDKRREQRKKI